MIEKGDIIKRSYGTFEVLEVLSETDKTLKVKGISKSGDNTQTDIVRIRKSTKIVKIN